MSNSRRRNFGFGKRLRYAGIQALKTEAYRYGGRYGWFDANLKRWARFCDFALENGVSDARFIDHELVERYSSTLDDCSVSTRQNYISSINVVMGLLAGESWMQLSPRGLVGRSRSTVRKTPINFDSNSLFEVQESLKIMGYARLSFVPVFSFYMGLRRREAALLDIGSSLKESKNTGFVDIHRGTKGGRGRFIDRWIPADDNLISALTDAYEVLASETRCLITKGQTYKSFSDDISNIVLPVLKRNGIVRLHDLRSAYACERYKTLTGHEAPCNLRGKSDVDPSVDEKVRLTIGYELGHGRTDVVSAYIGAKPRYEDRHYDKKP